MPDFDSNSVLTYSTLQTMGLGAGSSNSPMQGSTGGTSVPFNAIPYGGGHIPPSSPSLGGAFQQPIGPNANYNLFGAGSLGPLSYTTSVGSMSFSLFDAFGNNNFSSSCRLGWGQPQFWATKSCAGYYSYTGGKYKSFLLTRTLESLEGISSLARDVGQGKPLPWSMEPHRAQYLCLSDRLGASPSKILGTQCREKSPPNPCRPIMGVIQ
jgi:hypothetical protein